MVCIQCGQKTGISNSRPQRRSNQVWRRRQCESCGTVFTTLEAVDYSVAWAVRGRNDRLLPFSRDSLFLSLYDACQHRPHALPDAAALTDTIIAKLGSKAQQGVLSGASIKQVALVALNRFDKAASVRYAALHQA